MSGVRTFARRVLHGPAFSALLVRCGIDVRRFRLLVEPRGAGRTSGRGNGSWMTRSWPSTA